jgi:hypothetical protein
MKGVIVAAALALSTSIFAAATRAGEAPSAASAPDRSVVSEIQQVCEAANAEPEAVLANAKSHGWSPATAQTNYLERNGARVVGEKPYDADNSLALLTSKIRFSISTYPSGARAVDSYVCTIVIRPGHNVDVGAQIALWLGFKPISDGPTFMYTERGAIKRPFGGDDKRNVVKDGDVGALRLITMRVDKEQIVVSYAAPISKQQ